MKRSGARSCKGCQREAVVALAGGWLCSICFLRASFIAETRAEPRRDFGEELNEVRFLMAQLAEMVAEARAIATGMGLSSSASSQHG